MRGSQSDKENRIHVSTDLGGLLRLTDHFLHVALEAEPGNTRVVF